MTALETFDLVLDLAVWHRSQRARHSHAIWATPDSKGMYKRDALPEYAPMIANRLAEASVFWVNPDMSTVVEQASRSLPDTVVDIREAPSQVGFVLFSKVMPAQASEEGADRADGFLWFWETLPARLLGAGSDPRFEAMYPGLVDQEQVRTLTVVPFATKKAMIQQFGIEEAGNIAATDVPALPFDPHAWPVGYPTQVNLNPLRTIRTFWLLAGQRVASVARTNAPRAAARRAMRVLDHVPDIAVVSLRRPAGQPSEKTEPGFVDWSHRWIVGGHWRNQWLPSEERHEPRWIAPYIKGPENKPLVADRVYQLVR